MKKSTRVSQMLISFKAIATALLMLTAIISVQTANAQGKLLNKMLTKAAKKVGEANAVSTSTLDDVVPTVGIGSNLYPAELGTISQSFFAGWKTGRRSDLYYVYEEKRTWIL